MDAITKRPLAPRERIDETNISFYESDAMAQASKMISALESALAKWDSSPAKPPQMRGKFEGYRALLARLSEWERGALLSKNRNEALPSRLARLRNYV
ncbi:MAG: hypothetical protein AB1324_01195, partial [Candidatus Micrarchaeota archaeon]